MMVATAGERSVLAEPGQRAECPLCQAAVIAKCGQIVSWHWAHEAGADCDPWAEADTAWHHYWQGAAPPERREVVMGPHRADLLASDGTVVELQHSSIAPEMITERESFYGRAMVWLFDARDAYEDDRLLFRKRWEIRNRPGVLFGTTFRWKHPRKSIAWCQRPVLLDVGYDEVLWLKKFGLDGPPYGGSGWVFAESYVKNWLG